MDADHPLRGSIFHADPQLPELLANPGVVSGRKAALSEVQMGPSDIQSRYVMMTLTTRDLPAVFRKIVAGGPPSPALDRTRGYGLNYRIVTSWSLSE